MFRRGLIEAREREKKRNWIENVSDGNTDIQLRYHVVTI